MAIYNGLATGSTTTVVHVFNAITPPPTPKVGQIWPRGAKASAG